MDLYENFTKDFNLFAGQRGFKGLEIYSVDRENNVFHWCFNETGYLFAEPQKEWISQIYELLPLIKLKFDFYDGELCVVANPKTARDIADERVSHGFIR